MPLKIKITLGSNTFEADGDTVLDEGFATVFRAWINAQSETAQSLDEVTARLKASTDSLEGAVDAASIPPA